MENYYTILGVSRTATQQEIKKAYKQQAIKWHPDKNKDVGAEDMFKKIQSAYEVLGDVDKKSQYDALLTHASKKFSFDDNGKLQKDFEAFFTNLQRNKKKTTNRKRLRAVITLEQSYCGTTIEADGKHLVLPRGIRSGTKVSSDSFIVEVIVKPHHKFRRSGDDLLIEVVIDSIEAMTGLPACVTHLDGSKYKFNITSGIQHGQIIRLQGNGMPNPETKQQGNLMVQIKVVTPKLDTEQINSIQHLLTRADVNI